MPAIAGSLSRRCPRSVSFDAEDLAQIGRSALWKACAAYDESRAATFRVYVRSRIRGAMLDWIRGRQYREAEREQRAERFDDPDSNLQPMAAVSARDPFVARAVASLGGRQAAVLGLRFHAELTRREVADRLGITPWEVGASERAAIKSLRQILRAA